MLGGEQLGHAHRLVDVVDQRDRALAVEGRLDTLAVPRAGDLVLEGRLDGLDELGGGGDQQAGGQLVVLGLGDEVGGDHARLGRAVGHDGDLGRPGVPVDADATLGCQPLLGQADVEVARADDEVARRHAGGAVGHGGDRLGSADPDHAVHAEQCGRRQDGAVGPPVLAGRRRAEHDLVHAGDLGRHDGHDHRRGVDGLAAGHVHAGPLDGAVPLAHAGAVAVVLPVPGSGALVEPAHLVGGAFQRRPEVGVEVGERLVEDLRRHHEVVDVEAVEPTCECPQRLVAVVPDRGERGVHAFPRRRQVDPGTGQSVTRVGAVAAKVEHGQPGHGGFLGSGAPRAYSALRSHP